VQLGTDPGFSSGLRVNDSTVVDTLREVFALDNNTVYYWRVNAKNAVGTSAFSQIWNFATSTTSVDESHGVPQEFSLSQNYPNPFNPSTIIGFALPRESYVKLEVYDLLGERIATLVDETRPAGYYSVEFNTDNHGLSATSTSGLGSGLYFYRLSTPEASFTKKMLLLR